MHNADLMQDCKLTPYWWDDVPRPLYRGNPWFLAPSVAYYRWRDSRPV